MEIEGDTCIYCESRIAWYFHTADGLYWVTRADLYPQLPDITVLRTLRTVDRARLDAWTAARAVQQHEAVAQELGCRITQQRFKPPPAGPRQTTTDHVERLTREREQLEKERAEEA